MTIEETNQSAGSGGANPDAGNVTTIAAQIGEALRGLRFGQVTITVHDGAVVQIERLERTRLQRRVQPS